MKRVLGSLLVVSSILLTSHALAQSTGSAEAEELFKQGRAALEAKDYVTAHTKLAESNRLERAVGTLISLAQCEEAQGMLASARQHWQEAADFADALQDRLQRGAGAREKFGELDKRVPRLTVNRAPNAPTMMVVKRDEVTLTSASFGSALPLDPGKHLLVVSAEQHEPRTFEVTLTEGENRVIDVEPGLEIAVAPPPPPPADSETRSTPGDDSSLRTVSYVVGGAGVVGLGIGAVFGLRAASKWSDAQSNCKPNECGAGSKAQTEKDDASSAGTISTIAFTIGAAALVTGITLFVISPASKTPPSTGSVRVAPGWGGLVAVGRF